MTSDFDFAAMIERIKARKKELKMTNAQLSELSGVSFGTLNKILGSETKEPSIANIIKIAAALGVDADYLITGQKKAPTEPIALKASRSEWVSILERMTDENLIKLRDYALLLLLSQGQADQGDQESPK